MRLSHIQICKIYSIIENLLPIIIYQAPSLRHLNPDVGFSNKGCKLLTVKVLMGLCGPT